MGIEIEHYDGGLTEPDVRQWLESVRVLKERIESRSRQIEDLKKRRDSLVKAIGDGGSGGPRRNFTDVSDRLIDMIREIQAEVETLRAKRQEVVAAIDVLPEPLKLLVELRYFEGLKFWQIEKKMHYSRTTLWEKHEEALKILRQARKSEHH